MSTASELKRERALGSILEITEAQIDGMISAEEGKALFNARLADRELTQAERNTAWAVRHSRLNRSKQQMLEEAREEAFWDDLLGILRKARAFMPGPSLEKTIIEVKKRR